MVENVLFAPPLLLFHSLLGDDAIPLGQFVLVHTPGFVGRLNRLIDRRGRL